MLNVFESDAFSFTTLTGAVNLIDPVPFELGQWLPWEEQGINTLTALIDEKDGKISVIPSSPRGDTGSAISSRSPRVRSIVVPHYQHYDSILATEVQGVRMFGSDNAMETVENKRNEKLANMQANHELTWEFGRSGVLKGKLFDANGDVLVDWHGPEGFNCDRTTHPIALNTATTDVVQELIKAKRKAQLALKGLVTGKFKLICTATLFDKIVTHPMVKAAYDRWQEGAFLRSDNDKGFMLADIEIVLYLNNTVNGVDFLEEGKGYLCPIVPGLYKVRYAPADTLEAANTIGLPLYSMGEPMKFGKGIELSTESNAVHYCERPASIVEISIS
jgi:hypothetical protein